MVKWGQLLINQKIVSFEYSNIFYILIINIFPLMGVSLKTYFLSDLIKPNNFYYKKTYFLRKKKS